MSDQQLITQIHDWKTLANWNRINGSYDVARNAMYQAQDEWTPTLGIPKPDFSSEEWRSLHITQMEKMLASAEQNARGGWRGGAATALQAACTAWERLEVPRPPRPDISEEARARLGRDLGRKTILDFEDVVPVSSWAERAKQDLADGSYYTAQGKMRQAQEKWTPTLGIALPNFSSEEWRSMHIAQMEQMLAAAERNALIGWRSGVATALQGARTFWERLEEPRPPRPNISQDAQARLGEDQRGNKDM
jgi:hypothetical protein